MLSYLSKILSSWLQSLLVRCCWLNVLWRQDSSIQTKHRDIVHVEAWELGMQDIALGLSLLA
jgi:hypothetical protein